MRIAIKPRNPVWDYFTKSERNASTALFAYWHCSRSMLSKVCETVRCPSVCPSHSPAAAGGDGFAAVGPAGRRYRSIAARRPATARGRSTRAAANAGTATFSALDTSYIVSAYSKSVPTRFKIFAVNVKGQHCR